MEPNENLVYVVLQYTNREVVVLCVFESLVDAEEYVERTKKETTQGTLRIDEVEITR